MKAEFAILLLGRIVQMLVLVLTFRVMTAELSPAEVGVVSLLTSVGTVFVWLLTAPVGGYVSRHTFGWWLRGTVWVNSLRYTGYVLLISLLAIPATWLWALWSKPDWHLPGFWPLIVAVYIFASVLVPTFINTLNILNRRVPFVLFSVVQQVALLGFAWAASLIHHSGVFWFAGQVAGYAFAGAAAFATFLHSISIPAGARPSHAAGPEMTLRQSLTDVFRFSFPLAFVGAFYWLQFQGYRVIISQLTSLSFLGLFFAGYSVSAGVIGAVDAVAGQFITPYFYKHIEQAPEGRRFDFWAGYLGTMYPLMIIIGASLIALSGPVSHLLLARRFWPASIYIGVGAVVEVCRYLTTYYNLAAQVSKKTILTVAPQAISSIAMAVLMVVGTKLFGDRAIGPAMIIAALIFLVAIHVTMVPHSGTKLIILAWQPMMLGVLALAGLFVVLQHVQLAGMVQIVEFLAIGGAITLAVCLYIIRAARDMLVRLTG